MAESEKVCSTCRWWKPEPDDGKYRTMGECRQKPPVPVFEPHPQQPMTRAVWPLTTSTEWCGRWLDGSDAMVPDRAGRKRGAR